MSFLMIDRGYAPTLTKFQGLISLKKLTIQIFYMSRFVGTPYTNPTLSDIQSIVT